MPGGVAAIAFQNKRLLYSILFDAVAATLKTIAADPRHRLGGELGFIGILHTWGQTLSGCAWASRTGTAKPPRWWPACACPA